MLAGEYLALPLMLVLLYSGIIIPHSFASVESEAQEDIQAGCRDAQILVYRMAYKDYVCVELSTAERWEELGLAKTVQKTSFANAEENPAAPTDENDIPEQSKSSEGSPFSSSENSENIVDNSQDLETPSDLEAEPEPTLESDPESSSELSPNTLSSTTSSTTTSLDFPKIHQIEDRIWTAVGHDAANSILIEGEKGIIVIDTLSSYESSKKLFEEFRTISDKPVKTIVYTTINPELVMASEAFIQEGDGAVEVIISEDLLAFYLDHYDLDFYPTHTFSSNLSIDVSGIKMSIASVDGVYSDQVYISLPDYDGMLIGDSIYGISPFILDVEYLQNFSDG